MVVYNGWSSSHSLQLNVFQRYLRYLSPPERFTTSLRHLRSFAQRALVLSAARAAATGAPRQGLAAFAAVNVSAPPLFWNWSQKNCPFHMACHCISGILNLSCTISIGFRKPNARLASELEEKLKFGTYSEAASTLCFPCCLHYVYIYIYTYISTYPPNVPFPETRPC